MQQKQGRVRTNEPMDDRARERRRGRAAKKQTRQKARGSRMNAKANVAKIQGSQAGLVKRKST